MAGPVEDAATLLTAAGIDVTELYEDATLARACAEALSADLGLSYIGAAQLVELVSDRYRL